MKKLTFPEWLAFFRIITFPVLVVLLFVIDRVVFGLIYVILFSTDALDGFTAWLLDNDSDRREILDTWGDNLYLTVGLAGFYYHEPAFFQSKLIIILTIIILYIIELIMSLIKFGRPSHFHNYLSKVAVFFMIIFLAWLFIFDINTALFYIVIVLIFLDIIDEFIILFSLKKWRTHIRGFWEVV